MRRSSVLTRPLTRFSLAALCCIPLATAYTSAAEAADAVTPRVQDTWDLSGVYPTIEAWQAAVVQVNADADKLAACQGHLREQLRPCLDQRFAVQELANRVNTYASNLSNHDTRDAEWQGRAQVAELAYTHFDSVSSFFAPEILAIGGPGVEAAIAADPGLKTYAYYLRSIVQDAPHTLDAAGEQLLASSGTIRGEPDHIHGLLINAELPWPDITLSDGTAVHLDPSAYTLYRQSPKREDRALVFDAFFGALKKYQGVLGATLGAAVQSDWFVAQARHYDTSVAASVDGDHVPAAVYATLVSSTNKNLPTLHRYLRLRAKMLGITDLAYSDLYPPLVANNRTWTVDEATALTLEATRPLGAAYTSQMEAGFKGRWMDVYPSLGKRGGAYMDGAAYAVHPFLLLNYNGDYESVSTLAHEWGHAMHSVLSAKAQPYATADYATFIAEIASTCNEALLMQAMLRNAKDDDERLFFLGSQLEGLRTTYFRQAQFAEFEMAIHDQVEHGTPLTGESLSATYLDILKRYYGDKEGVTHISERDAMEWAYIPHFYYNFYVYQYATSIAASSQFSADILAKKPGVLDKYITLLSSGGSDDPYKLLTTAGVDLATPAPYDAVAAQMNRVMDQMEALIAKKAGAKPGKKGK